MDNEKHPLVGIDLGTTFCAVARWTGTDPEDLKNNNGLGFEGTGFTTQSAFLVDPDPLQPTQIGTGAFRKGMRSNPDRLIIGVKRLIDRGDEPCIEAGGRRFSPIGLSSELLRQIATDHTSGAPGYAIRGSVVTVPYYFTANEVNNTKIAAERADIKCLGILAEPVAAALSVAFRDAMGDLTRKRKESILIFDLGGGTFDLTLASVEQEGKSLRFSVDGIDGHRKLGGMDFDRRLCDVIVAKARHEGAKLPDPLTFPSPSVERHFNAKLLSSAIEAKHDLAQINEFEVLIEYNGEYTLVLIGLSELATALAPHLTEVENILKRFKAERKLSEDGIDRLILVGGSSRLRAVQDLVRRYVGAKAVWSGADPDLSVSRGAAVYAAYLENPANVGGLSLEIVFKTAHDFGVRAGGRFEVIVPRGSTVGAGSILRKTFFPVLDLALKFAFDVLQGRADGPLEESSKIGAIPPFSIPRPGRSDTVPIEIEFEVTSENMLVVRCACQGEVKETPFEYA